MTHSTNPLKDAIAFMQLRSLPVSIAGVLAATTANIASGHINIMVTILFLIAVMGMQMMANLSECYFRIKDKRMSQSEMESDIKANSAGGPLLMATRMVFNVIAFVTITVSLPLIVGGNYWLLLLAAFAFFCAYINSGYKKPQGTTIVGIIICFICFGPLEVLAGFILNEHHCDNTSLASLNLSNMFSLGAMVGLMAVNVLFVYIYTMSEKYMDNEKAGVTLHLKRNRVLWAYAINSVLITALGCYLVLSSKFMMQSPAVMIVNILPISVYAYIWKNLPKAVNSTKMGLRLQNIAMRFMVVYFVIVLVWILVIEGGAKILDTYFL